MLKFRKKDQFKFGMISAADDQGIEVFEFRKAARHNLWYEILRFLRDVVLIGMVLLLVMVFVVQPVAVDGVSMVPYLENGDRLVVNKLVYYDFKSVGWGHIERGDIVVFWYPKDPNKSFVKRVVGLPGETISVRNGQIYVDGALLNEPYLDPDHNQAAVNRSSVLVDDYHYFVMGDNRDQSLDSRMWGLVPSKYIFGKAFFRFWRPAGFGSLPDEKPSLGEADPTRNDSRAENSD